MHGAGGDPSGLVGARLQRVVASRHVLGDLVDAEPIDVWLIDDAGACTHITSGSDWCLIVEASAPFEGYDMGTWGRVEVHERSDTPFASHVGERVLSVEQVWAPMTGRVALVIAFESGPVCCESQAGELRLRT